MGHGRAVHAGWVVLGLVVAMAASGRGESPRALVAEGNRAYKSGKLNEAMAAYDKASVAAPESAYIYFDRGTVYYQKEDYEKAKDAFEKAALKADNLPMEARCKYNLGNCCFREGERQKGGDLKKALAAYETSIKYYQAALKLDPTFQDAGHNIEVARLVLKDLLDKIKKQQEEAAKQQKQQNEIAEKLKELIDRQQKHVAQNEKLASAKTTSRPAADRSRQIRELADQQKATKDETRKLSEKLAQAPAATQPAESPVKKARAHVDRAAEKQAAGESQLQKEQLAGAQPPQKEALKELKDALAALSDPQQNPQQSGQDKQDKQDKKDNPQQKQQQQQQKQQQDKQQQDKQQQQKKDPQKAAAKRDEKARDILNEEKENHEQRMKDQQGNYQPVDKDW